MSDFYGLPVTLSDPLARARAPRALRGQLSQLLGGGPLGAGRALEASRPCECEHCEHWGAFPTARKGCNLCNLRAAQPPDPPRLWDCDSIGL